MPNLYDVLVRLCNAKGVTLAQMCKDNGKYYSFVTDIKAGRKSSLSQKNYEQLSQYFGVPISTFFEETTDPVELAEDELLVKKKLLFDISNKATPEQLDQIIKIVKAITEE